MDVQFMGSKDITQWLQFDRTNQVINIRQDLPADHPLGLKNYIYYKTLFLKKVLIYFQSI